MWHRLLCLCTPRTTNCELPYLIMHNGCGSKLTSAQYLTSSEINVCKVAGTATCSAAHAAVHARRQSHCRHTLAHKVACNAVLACMQPWSKDEQAVDKIPDKVQHPL